jgi:hypothetical protein
MCEMTTYQDKSGCNMKEKVGEEYRIYSRTVKERGMVLEAK